MPPEMERILRETPELERAFLVGGRVRDALLGLPAGCDHGLYPGLILDLNAGRPTGSHELVGEITRFLEEYQATLVDGPKPGGFYRVRITMKTLAKEELARIVSRMRQERVVETADAGDSD